jgi:hypothetical protein
MLESESFMVRCVELIQHDKNLSEETLIIMFMQYKKLLELEIKEKNINKYGKNGNKN